MMLMSCTAAVASLVLWLDNVYLSGTFIVSAVDNRSLLNGMWMEVY